jgi:tyramine---L-glutamate ligase
VWRTSAREHERVAACGQRRHDRAVGLAPAAQRPHHLPLLEIDDGNDEHMTIKARIFLYEFLSGGGSIDSDPAATSHLRPQGQAMRDAIAADLMGSNAFALTVAGCDAAPVPDGAAPAKARDGEAALDFAARESARHDAVWVVAPETGGLLAALHRAVADRACWIGCSAAAISIASSKAATVERLAARGVLTPLAFPSDGAWVAKPDDGAGATDTRVWPSLDAARAAAAQTPGRWIEPWVEGDALSLSLRCTARDAELLSVNRQRVSRDAHGVLVYEGVTIDAMAPNDARRDALQALARDVHRALPGLRGYVGIDVVWHPARGPVAIEVNPRATSAYVGLSQRLGRNLGDEIVREQLDD